MPNLNDICRDLVENVDFALASAVIDQESGLLLGVSHNVSYFTQTFLDAVAAATVEMFRGKGISAVEKMLGEIRENKPQHSVNEIQMTTGDIYHFMTVVPDKPHLLAVLVARKQVNLGMGWTGLRSRLKEIAQVCP